MTDTTKAQQWWRRLADECEQPFVAIRYFDHLHDLADCAYHRAEEVAADVADLRLQLDTEVQQFHDTVNAHYSAHLEAARNTTPPEDAAPVVARDTSNAAEPFVDDATVIAQMYAGRFRVFSTYAVADQLRFIYRLMTGIPERDTDLHAQMLERAAAPTPTRTISRERLKELATAYARATDEVGLFGGIEAVLDKLGFEVEP